jgi:hypothetical protein
MSSESIGGNVPELVKGVVCCPTTRLPNVPGRATRPALSVRSGFRSWSAAVGRMHRAPLGQPGVVFGEQFRVCHLHNCLAERFGRKQSGIGTEPSILTPTNTS